MILTGHQPTYLPWLGLFNKISNSDYFILFDTVQYLPKEWMNRNKLKSPNGSFFNNYLMILYSLQIGFFSANKKFNLKI